MEGFLSDIKAEIKNRKWLKVWLTMLGVFVIFGFGYGLGSGNLGFAQNNQNKNLPSSLNTRSVQKVYDLLRKNFDGDLDEGKLTEGMKKGLVNAAGDPHTEFFTAQETKEFNEELNGTFSGIGAELGKDGDAIIIVSPISGFPAEKAGLKAKDIIAEIDGQSTYGLTVSEAAKKIRGPENTEVTLRIIRNKQEDLKFTIKRENITIPSVESKTLEDGTGYIKISRFSDDTVNLTQEAAEKFKTDNVKHVILDLRGNPGGLLDAAVGVSSIWLPKGKTVLQEKRGGVVIKTYDASGDSILDGVPTIVMIDEGSASASEIVSGALKDNGVAKLLGTKSYGKGSVQSVENLPDGSSLKVTVARWFTPDGRNIDKEGIEPDIKVEQSKDQNEDAQLKAAMAQFK